MIRGESVKIKPWMTSINFFANPQWVIFTQYSASNCNKDSKSFVQRMIPTFYFFWQYGFLYFRSFYFTLLGIGEDLSAPP